MKNFFNVCLGNYMQNVSIIDDKGLVRIEKVPTADLPVFFSKLEKIDEITLKGPSVYIQKIKKYTEYQIGNTKTIKFNLEG